MKKKVFKWRWGEGRPIGEIYWTTDDWYIRIEEEDGIKHYRYYKWLYEQHNGPIPDGYDVHHIDGNHYNNDLDNLQVVSRSEHMHLHKS